MLDVQQAMRVNVACFTGIGEVRVGDMGIADTLHIRQSDRFDGHGHIVANHIADMDVAEVG